jgi:hypothetical protein
MRLGIAEIDQHTIAHVFGDKAGEASDPVGDAAVIGAEDLAQILGIKAGRERRRADQVAEHHGQLAPLSFGRDRSRRGCCLGDGPWSSAAKRGDRRQQLAPMADRRDPEANQILGRQLGQYLPVDVVSRKGRRILPEPETPQPFGAIDRHCLSQQSCASSIGSKLCRRYRCNQPL